MPRRISQTAVVSAGRRPPAASGTWVVKLYDAADEVFWAAKINALWLLFTAAGGVLLGVGPATVAAYTLARRHALDESFQAFPAFLSVYRREFVRGSLLLLPILGVSVFLVGNYFYFASMAPAGTAPRLATLAALAAVVVIVSFLLPMAVHYDLRAPALLPKASLFALTRPVPSVLLLFLCTAVIYASTMFPFLVLTVAIGGWIQLNTWLCLRFFDENEARLRVERIP